MSGAELYPLPCSPVASPTEGLLSADELAPFRAIPGMPGMPEWLRGRGRRLTIPSGGVLDAEAPMLRFVVAGGLGAFADVDHLCVAWLAPGSVQGLRYVFGGHGRPVVQAILQTTILEVPVRTLQASMPADEVEGLFGRVAGARMDAAEAEAACIATHAIEQRLAKWLLRLLAATPEGPLLVTQERLGQLLGVQRTSVNAALAGLQATGAIQSRRGRLFVHDPERLAATACGCDAANGHDSGVFSVHTGVLAT